MFVTRAVCKSRVDCKTPEWLHSVPLCSANSSPEHFLQLPQTDSAWRTSHTRSFKKQSPCSRCNPHWVRGLHVKGCVCLDLKSAATQLKQAGARKLIIHYGVTQAHCLHDLGNTERLVQKHKMFTWNVNPSLLFWHWHVHWSRRNQVSSNYVIFWPWVILFYKGKGHATI